MNRNELIDDVKKSNLEFDFDNFFFKNNDEKALRIITPKQTITSITDNHEIEAQKIMNAIYGNVNFTDTLWTDEVNNRGSIAIQMLRRDFEIVHLPNFINEYQFNELFAFYKDIMNVNRKLQKLGEKPIEVFTDFYLDDNFLKLGKALLELRYFIKNDLENPDEIIISESKRNIKS